MENKVWNSCATDLDGTEINYDWIYVIIVAGWSEESNTVECAFNSFEEAENYVKGKGFTVEKESDMREKWEEDEDEIREEIDKYGYYCVKENPHDYCFIKKVRIY